MKTPRVLSLVPVLCLAALSLTACRSGLQPGRVGVVASLYPLAWAAGQVGGSRVSVEDLTPPGVEAHDTTLTAIQRADLEKAQLVLLLGTFGFQPDVEKAAAGAAQGRVVDVTSGLSLLSSDEKDIGYDPHVWLDPALMSQIVGEVRDGLVAADPAGGPGYVAAAKRTQDRLAALDESYRSTLSGCKYKTFVTTHQAFGYLARQYGLQQLGVEGLTPESEPSAGRIQAAISAIDSETAGPAVFYEATSEGKRIGQSVAADAKVPALPLGTLETAPVSGDYISVMQANLANLAKGLQCPV